jgi:hypothetical protein
MHMPGYVTVLTSVPGYASAPRIMTDERGVTMSKLFVFEVMIKYINSDEIVH